MTDEAFAGFDHRKIQTITRRAMAAVARKYELEIAGCKNETEARLKLLYRHIEDGCDQMEFLEIVRRN